MSTPKLTQADANTNGNVNANAVTVANANAKSLFSSIEAGNAAIEIETKHYVSASDKEVLLEKILNDYQLLNAKEKSCPFTHVKKELSQKYGIETRSISNFFVSLSIFFGSAMSAELFSLTIFIFVEELSALSV